MQHQELTHKLTEQFQTFMEYVPAERLNRNLRNMLLRYFDYEKDPPAYFYDLLTDLYFLFNLLDVVADETRKN